MGRRKGKQSNRPKGLKYSIKKENPGWFKDKGGATTKKGYVYHTVKGKAMMEHRRVMEKAIGRTLEENEVIHHINGNKSDNRPENLQVLTKERHDRFHRGRPRWGLA